LANNTYKPQIFAVIAVVLLSVIWGTNVPYMKVALNFSGPAEFAFLRNFFGAIILFAILLFLKKPIFIKEAPKLFILGIFQTAGFTGFLIWALMEGGASKTAVLTFTMPMWVALMSWPFLQEKLTLWQWISVIICILGIIFVFNPLNIENNSTSTLLALASGFTWACGAILSKRIHVKFPKIDLLIMTAWQMLWGSIPLLVIALLIKSEPIIWSYSFLSILCFNAIFVNAIAYLLWFYALRHLQASTVSMLALLTPIAGAISAYFLLDEVPNFAESIGFFLILSGLFLLLFYKSKQSLS
jgi:drug/metabolite transporter (DMT)-like permease